MAQQHQPMQMDFDGWDLGDPVGLVEAEAAVVGDRSEVLTEERGGRSRRVAPASRVRSAPLHRRKYEKNRRSHLGIDESTPGVLVDPLAPMVVEPSIEPSMARDRDGMTTGMALRILRRLVVLRCRRLWRWELWRFALLAVMVTGSATLLKSVVRWQPAETFAAASLRDSCLTVTNGEGTVPAAKSEGVAQLVGKNRQEVTKALGAPYCQLPKTSVRSGAILDRSLYQLEGDRQMVVAFEGDRIIGYGIDPPADGNVHGTGDRHDFDLRQSWGWLPGAQVADRSVVGGLGSIALAMDGPVHAPMDGVVYEQAALVAEGQLSRLPSSCGVFTSVQLPAYAVQLCGLRDRRVGAVTQGQVLGRSEGFLHVSVLRREGNQWMFVPPSPEIVEQILGAAA